jgi:glycosyltransferase involved in cell wall biosynthesis
VIVPSLSETFGLIILEAWAAHAPALSTRTSGALSLVEENENGHLFDLKNEAEFDHALQRVLESPAHARRIAENGYTLAAQEYDSLILSRRMKNLYEELIRERA